MRATVLHAARDIRLETVPDPELVKDSDAIVRVVATCICGSDLWPYRGENELFGPFHIGHEFVGVVEQVGSAVATLSPGDFVVAPFAISDNTCIRCEQGIHTSCLNGAYWGGNDRNGDFVNGGQGELVRVPLADGTLVKTPGEPASELVPHLLTLSDVFPTGHHAAVSAGVSAGSNVVVVGDGAVGLSAVLAAKRLGAGQVVAMSRHPERQAIARQFGADHIIESRGREGAAEAWEYLGEEGADCVLECVGTAGAMDQALRSTRPGGTVGYVGVPHGVELPIGVMFGKNIGVNGGGAPVRAYLDELLPEVWKGSLQPGAVFDTTLPLDRVADGYQAMDQRTATKVLLQP